MQSRARSRRDSIGKNHSGRKRTRGKEERFGEREFIVFLPRAISSTSYILKVVDRGGRQSGSHVDNGVRRVSRCFFFFFFLVSSTNSLSSFTCARESILSTKPKSHFSERARRRDTMAEWKASSNVNDIQSLDLTSCSFPAGRKERLVFPMQLLD